MSQPLDDYLNRVARELRFLPPSVRENELREIRSHLEQLSADFEAQGLAIESAQSRAVEEFASPRVLGAKLSDAWEGQAFTWKHVLAAICCGFCFWTELNYQWRLGLNYAFARPDAAPFPAWPQSTTLCFLLIPSLTGMIFSAWIGRRSWMLSAAFFGLIAPCLNPFVKPFQFGFNAYSLAFPRFWLEVHPFFLIAWNFALGIAGAVTGNLLLRRRFQAKLALADLGALPTTSFLPQIRFEKRYLKFFLSLTVGLGALAGVKWRLDVAQRPPTAIAAWRAHFISAIDASGDTFTRYQPPQILQLSELPPQTPAERAGKQRRVAFHIEARAREVYAARRIAYLESRLRWASKTPSPSTNVIRASLQRVRIKVFPLDGVVTVKNTRSGWRVDEKDFDWQRLRIWVSCLYIGQ